MKKKIKLHRFLSIVMAALLLLAQMAFPSVAQAAETDNLSFDFTNSSANVRGGESTTVAFRLINKAQSPVSFAAGEMAIRFNISPALPEGYSVSGSQSASGTDYALSEVNDVIVMTMGEFQLNTGDSGMELMYYITFPNGVIDDQTVYTITAETEVNGTTVANMSGDSMQVNVTTDQYQWGTVTRQPSFTGTKMLTTTSIGSFNAVYSVADAIQANVTGQAYTEKIVITDTLQIDASVNFDYATASNNITTNDPNAVLEFTQRNDGCVDTVIVTYTLENSSLDKDLKPTFRVNFSGGELDEDDLDMGLNTITAVTSLSGAGSEIGTAYPAAEVGGSSSVSKAEGQTLIAAGDLSFTFGYTKNIETGSESARITKISNSQYAYPGDTLKFQIYNFGNYQTEAIQDFNITDTFDSSQIYPAYVQTGAYSGFTSGAALNIVLRSGNTVVGRIDDIPLSSSSQRIDLTTAVNGGSPITAGMLMSVDTIVFEYGNVPAGFRIASSSATASLVIEYVVKTAAIGAATGLEIENTAKVSYRNNGDYSKSDSAGAAYCDNMNLPSGVTSYNKTFENLTNQGATQFATGDEILYTITFTNNTPFQIAEPFILEQFEGLKWDTSSGKYRKEAYITRAGTNTPEAIDINIIEKNTGGPYSYLDSYVGPKETSAIYNNNEDHLYIPVLDNNGNPLTLQPGDKITVSIVMVVTADESDDVSNTFEAWGGIPGNSNVLTQIGSGANKGNGSGLTLNPLLTLDHDVFRTGVKVAYGSGHTLNAATELLNTGDQLNVKANLSSSNTRPSGADVDVVDMVVRFPTAYFDFDNATHVSAVLNDGSGGVTPLDAETSAPWYDSTYTYVRCLFMSDSTAAAVPASVTLETGYSIELSYDVEVKAGAGDMFYNNAVFTTYAYFDAATTKYDWDSSLNYAANRGAVNWVNDKTNETDPSGMTESASLLAVSKTSYVKGGDEGGNFGYVRIDQPTTPLYLKDSAAETGTRTHTIYIYNTSANGHNLDISEVYYQLPAYEEITTNPININYYEYSNGSSPVSTRPGLSANETDGILKFGDFVDKSGQDIQYITIPRTGGTYIPSQRDYVTITFTTQIAAGKYDAAKAALRATNDGTITSQTVAAVYLNDGEVLNSYNSSSSYASWYAADTEDWDNNAATNTRYISQYRSVGLIDGTSVIPGITIRPMRKLDTGSGYIYSNASGSSLYSSQVMGWQVNLANDPNVADMKEPVFVVVLPAGMEYVSGGEWPAGWSLNELSNNSIEPQITTYNGLQVLSWKIEDMNLGDTTSAIFTFDAKMKSSSYLGDMKAYAYIVPEEFFYTSLAGYGEETTVNLDALLNSSAYGTALPGVVDSAVAHMTNSHAFSSEVSVTDDTSTAVSNSSNTAITLNNCGDTFKYNLTLNNTGASTDFKNVTLIDRLPSSGDYSNVYETPRGSTAAVLFDFSTIKATVIPDNGTGMPVSLIEGTDYIIEFTTAPGNTIFTVNDYTPGTDGAAVWTGTEPADKAATAMRITFLNDLKASESVVVTVDASFAKDQLPASGIVAHNSFGFGFNVGSAATVMSEPQNVSVLAYQQSVEGNLYLDSNHNGILDAGESYYANGIEVTLWKLDSNTQLWEQAAAKITNLQGYYTFGDLLADTQYKVAFNLPSSTWRISPETGEGAGYNAFSTESGNTVSASFTTGADVTNGDRVFVLDSGIYEYSSSGGGGTSNTSDTSSTSDTSDTSEISDTSDTSDTPGTSVTPGASVIPGTSDTPGTSNTPGSSGTPGSSVTPGTLDKSGKSNKLSSPNTGDESVLPTIVFAASMITAAVLLTTRRKKYEQ